MGRGHPSNAELLRADLPNAQMPFLGCWSLHSSRRTTKTGYGGSGRRIIMGEPHPPTGRRRFRVPRQAEPVAAAARGRRR
jgi:hypothetical protein